MEESSVVTRYRDRAAKDAIGSKHELQTLRLATQAADGSMAQPQKMNLIGSHPLNSIPRRGSWIGFVL
jgi:hypothetical protein